MFMGEERQSFGQQVRRIVPRSSEAAGTRRIAHRDTDPEIGHSTCDWIESVAVRILRMRSDRWDIVTGPIPITQKPKVFGFLQGVQQCPLESSEERLFLLDLVWPHSEDVRGRRMLCGIELETQQVAESFRRVRIGGIIFEG